MTTDVYFGRRRTRHTRAATVLQALADHPAALDAPAVDTDAEEK